MSSIIDNFRNVSIIGEIVNHSEVFIKGKTAYIPDFENLPLDVKKNLKAGIYTIGESKQVEGNFRAVILDETGTRVKDVTLKKVVNHPGTLDTMRNISNQMQLRQMNEKLSTIQELQSYQIEQARNQAMVTPFWDARDYILRAQLSNNPDERVAHLRLAVERLTTAINALYDDVRTSTKHLMQATKLPIFQPAILKKRFISQITQDLQLLTR